MSNRRPTAEGTPAACLRRRLLERRPTIGTFFKTPQAYQQLEILGDTGLHLVALDAEHAPFDSASLDVCLLAARAAALPAVVRVPAQRPDMIGGALDMGASGVIVPHVGSADAARELVSRCRFRGGKRGVSGSPRAGDYGGRDLNGYLDAADREVTLIFQIEDAQGVENIDEIARVPGGDGLLIGPVDLAMGLGASGPEDDIVDQAISRICSVAAGHERAVGIYLGSPERVAAYRNRGISFFMVGSDQSLIRAGARANVKRFQESQDDGA